MSKEQRRMLNKICFKGNLSRMRYAIQQLDRFNEIRKAAMDAVLKNLHAIQSDGAEVLGEEPKPNSWYMLDDEIAMFTPVCRQCGKQFFIAVLREDYDKYEKGALVQDAFPYLSADNREMIISQTCPECWVNIFKK